ncbi:MAG: hypothetical protein IKC49_03040, partial [Clostridia bacterium]|nr:hypothetical protein [Clostridia bacterium]
GNYVATATAKEPKYFNKHEVEGYDRLVFNIEASKPNSNELSGLKILGFYDIVNCEYVDLSSYNITYPSWILHHPSSMDVLDDYGVPDLLEYNKLEESEVHDQIMKYLARVKIDSATTKKEIEAIMDEYRLELSNIIEARNALAQKINGTNELSDIKEKALEELDKYGYQKMEDIIND